jgi:hypothetical protein
MAFASAMASAIVVPGALGEKGLDEHMAQPEDIPRATPDDELETLDREQLISEVKRLRAGIREHRDSTGHELCWHHPRLWALLPEPCATQLVVPEWPQFMRGCIRYRQSLDAQLPAAPRSSAEFDDATK